MPGCGGGARPDWDALLLRSLRACARLPGCLPMGGSRVCATGATIFTLVCGVKVYKQVMNICVSGSLILFRFLEMDINPIQATRCWLYELGVLRLIVSALIKLPFQS